MEHKPVFCAVEECKNEAERWIDIKGTLRLCLDHIAELTGENDPGDILGHETGIYCCGDDSDSCCGVCAS